MLKKKLTLSFYTKIIVALAIIPLAILGIYVTFDLIEKGKELKSNYSSAVVEQAEELTRYINKYIFAVNNISEQAGQFYNSQCNLKGTKLKDMIEKYAEHYEGFVDIFLNCEACQFSSKYDEITAYYILEKDRCLWNNVTSKFKRAETSIVSQVIREHNGNEIIFVAKPIKTKEGRYCGYVIGTLDMDEIYRLLKKGDMASLGHFVLVDGNNRVIYSYDRKVDSFPENYPILNALKKSSEGSLNYFSPLSKLGETACYLKLNNLGWTMWVTAPRYEVLLPLYKAMGISFGILLLGVFVIFSIKKSLINKIVIPLSQINKANSELAIGNLAYRVEFARNNILPEINKLGEGFNSMADNLEKVDSMLKKHGNNLERRVRERTRELVMKDKEMATLYAVVSSVNETCNLTDVINLVLNEVMKLFEVELANIYLHRTDNEKLVHTIWGANYPRTEKIIYTECTGWYSKLAMEKRDIVVIDDLQKNEKNVPLALCWSDMRSLVSVPIRYQDVVLGAVTLTSRVANRFKDQEIIVLQAVANQLGVVISNLALFNVVNEEHHTLLAVINGMHEGIIILDTRGKIIYVNPLLLKIFHLKESEWTADLYISEFRNYIDPETLIELPWDEMKKCYKEQQAYEYGKGSVTYKDNTNYYKVQGFPVMTGKTFIGYGYVMRDVTRERQVNILKDSILSTVSHEFRSPLTTIYGSADSLLRQGVTWTEDEKTDFIKAIIEESKRLEYLIDNIMDISKIEAGVFKLNLHNANISKITARVLKRLRDRYPKNIFKVDDRGDLPIIVMDEQRIEHVLNNLLENAVKYSSAEKVIYVKLGYFKKENMIKVGVIDQGIGIAPQYHKDIFKRFYRVENKMALRINGSGVGLAITKWIIKNHGGSIWVESSLGKGSEFYFTLPCKNVEGEEK